MPTPFTHLDTREVETTESFFSREFISARIDSGHDSNAGYDPLLVEGRDTDWLDRHWKEIKQNDLHYDEDVNQYITLTLAELAHPRYLELLNRHLVAINSDVGQRVAQFEEQSKAYIAYRINADYLLLCLGLFQQTQPQSREYIDKGETYYSCAATGLKKVVGGRSGLSDVLEKLSERFGLYVDILRAMKQRSDNYLSFHYRIPTRELEELQSTLTREVDLRRQDPGAIN